MDDEFLFGDDLLAAPVLHEGDKKRSIHLPPGNGYDYWTGDKFSGDRSFTVPVSLETIPMYVRGGGFMFRQPAVQNSDEMPGDALQVLIVPANESSSTLYEDDGETMSYRQGNFLKRTFCQNRQNHVVTIQVSRAKGSFRPATRNLEIQLWRNDASQAVFLAVGTNAPAATELPLLKANEFTNSVPAWTYGDGLLTVETIGQFVPMRFIME